MPKTNLNVSEKQVVKYFPYCKAKHLFNLAKKKTKSWKTSNLLVMCSVQRNLVNLPKKGWEMNKSQVSQH